LSHVILFVSIGIQTQQSCIFERPLVDTFARA